MYTEMQPDQNENNAASVPSGGQTYNVGTTEVVTGFNPETDVMDLGSLSIHTQIPVDTADGFAMVNMFNDSQSTLFEGVFLKDLSPGSFAPIADAHLQQDLSAALAWEDGTGLVRENTVYVRSHEAGVEEIVDFDPAVDTLSFFYLSVRGDMLLNFVAEDSPEGARFFSPITGQSVTLRDVSMSDLNSSHFEWRANQIEDNVAGRMGLTEQIDGFTYENVYGGKTVEMAGLVDRAPYHTQPDYTGTPINELTDMGGDDDYDDMGDDDGDTAPLDVTVTGGSVMESDPGEEHVHSDGTSHVHDDGHRFILFEVSLDEPATEELTLTYATYDGTAEADTSNSTAWDYHEATGTLVFAVGEQSKVVPVAVHPDLIVEGTETLTFTVSGENITGELTATGRIFDNDVESETDGDEGHSHDDDMSHDDMADEDMSDNDMSDEDMADDDMADDDMSHDDMAEDGHADAPSAGAFVATVGNQWNSAYLVETVFTPDESVEGWTVQMRIPGEISSIWNADIVGQDGDVYTLAAKDYNADVVAGQSVVFGFQVEGTDTSIAVVGQNDTTGDMGDDMDSDDGDMGAGDGDMGSDDGDMGAGDGDMGSDDGDMGADDGDMDSDDGDMGSGGSSSQGTYTIGIPDQWGDGYLVESTFTPDDSVDGWTVQLRIPGDIVNIWNAEVVNKEGDVYTLTAMDYNSVVSAGQSISFGFQVAGADTYIEIMGENVVEDDMGDDNLGAGGNDGDMGADDDQDQVGGGDDQMDDGDDQDQMGGGDDQMDDGDDQMGGDDDQMDDGDDQMGDGPTIVGGGDVLNGPLSTVGTDIIDASGAKVDLKGVNWFGFETDIGLLHGLWARNMEQMLDEIADFGFNMIRLPFAGELAVNDAIPSGLNTAENPDLVGMTSLEVIGEFLDAAADRGVGVLLDMHRTTPGDGPEGGGRIPDVQNFLDQWAAMADQFGDHPAVIGFDLYNEPHGYSWEEWAPIAEQAGNMLLESNPDELIIVEGVEFYEGEGHWWGGNLKGVAERPIELNADDKLVYSPHEYATSVFEQPYFTEAGYDPETTLPEIFSEHWGFIEEQGIAPVLVGEFGSTFENQTDKDWGEVLADYLIEQDIDWAIWSWNPNSGDTGGVVENDWETPREDAFTYLLNTLLSEQPESVAPVANQAIADEDDYAMPSADYFEF